MRIRASLSPEDQVRLYEWITGVRLKVPIMPGLDDEAVSKLTKALDSLSLDPGESFQLLGFANSATDKEDLRALVIALLIIDGTFKVEQVQADGSPLLQASDFEAPNATSVYRLFQDDDDLLCRKCGKDSALFPHVVSDQGKIICPTP